MKCILQLFLLAFLPVSLTTFHNQSLHSQCLRSEGQKPTACTDPTATPPPVTQKLPHTAPAPQAAPTAPGAHRPAPSSLRPPLARCPRAAQKHVSGLLKYLPAKQTLPSLPNAGRTGLKRSAGTNRSLRHSQKSRRLLLSQHFALLPELAGSPEIKNPLVLHEHLPQPRSAPA